METIHLNKPVSPYVVWVTQEKVRVSLSDILQNASWSYGMDLRNSGAYLSVVDLHACTL